MRVFISHSSKDKPAVEVLAVALRQRAIEPWLDKWEIGSGDDIVAKINAGLEEAPAGIIVFSEPAGRHGPPLPVRPCRCWSCAPIMVTWWKNHDCSADST